MTRYYIEPHEPWKFIPSDDPKLVHEKLYGAQGWVKIVARSDFGPLGEVSSVFLGTDHAFGEGRGPLLWETMIFGGPLNEYQVRDWTWCRCVARHSLVRKQLTRLRTRLMQKFGLDTLDAFEARWRLGGITISDMETE